MAVAADEFDARVARWWRSAGLPTEAPVLVACSGGADSVSLLLALSRVPLDLRVAYVDHGLRPAARSEGARVLALCASLGLPGRSLSVAVARTGNLLAAARAARYAALAELSVAWGCPVVAVGHTASDQAETVAMRERRGDLGAALAGIPAIRPLEGAAGLIARPLLGAGLLRQDTLARAAHAGWQPVDDPTNHDLRYARARARAELGHGRSAEVLRLLAVAARADEEARRAERAAAALGDPLSLTGPEVAAAEVDALLALLHRVGAHRAGRAEVEALRSLSRARSGSGRIDLGFGLVAERSYDRLRLGPAAPPEADERVPVTGPGRYALCGAEVRIVEGPAASRSALSLRRLPEELVLRNRRAGDRLRTAVGGRKLQDMLVDQKVPRRDRGALVLLAPAAGGDLCWCERIGPSHPLGAAPGEPAWQIVVERPAPPSRG